MVNTDYFQDEDIDNQAPHRTFGLGLTAGPGSGAGAQGRVSIRREHR